MNTTEKNFSIESGQGIIEIVLVLFLCAIVIILVCAVLGIDILTYLASGQDLVSGFGKLFDALGGMK